MKMGVRNGQKQVLITVAFLLVISGGLRTVTGVGPAMAIAQTDTEVQVDQDTPPEEDLDLV